MKILGFCTLQRESAKQFKTWDKDVVLHEFLTLGRPGICLNSIDRNYGTSDKVIKSSILAENILTSVFLFIRHIKIWTDDFSIRDLKDILLQFGRGMERLKRDLRTRIQSVSAKSTLSCLQLHWRAKLLLLFSWD